jgi:DNA-binding winged helix-turn-helix (wHTH) protein/Tol biopolymer transport system component
MLKSWAKDNVAATMNGGLQFGDFTLDVSERLLLREGRPVPLTPKAFDVLSALATRPGRLVTKDELIKEVWPDSFVEENNLAYHVFALRRALGETPEGGKYVETVPKRGYRFVAPVKVASRAAVIALLGSALDAKNADSEEEKAVDFGPDDSESRDRSSLALEHGERVGADTARGGQRASRFPSRTTALWCAAGACCVAAIVLVFVYRSPPPVAPELMKVEVSTEVRLTESSTFAISPDGRRLVFGGSGADGVVRLWVRSLDASDARPLAGTEVTLGGLVPPMFWSPDSRFVAFDAAGQLKKIEVAGGSPQTVCTLPSLAVGGSWNQSDVILVGRPDGGILRCPASGGAAAIVTEPDRSKPQSAHLFPWFLPDGRRFLYLSVSRAAPENSGIYMHSLDAPAETTSSHRILAAGFGAAYVPDGGREVGHLLFMRDGALFAQDFEPALLQFTGEAARIAEPVGSILDWGFFSASRNGRLAFRAPEETLQLTWLDRHGKELSRVGEPGRYGGLSLAPGETRAVVVQYAPRSTIDQDLWLVDLKSARSSKLTSNARLEDRPVWSEDGKRVVFTGTGEAGSLFEQSIGSEQEARLLLESSQHKIPTSISRDGRFLLYTSVTNGSTRLDVWALPLTGERKPYPLIRRAFDQDQARLSPDGRWVAYVSNESGRREVLVRPFALVSSNVGESAEPSVMVSKSGGTAPRWRGDGKELFFVTLEGAVASVPVSDQPVLEVGSLTTLFQAPGIAPDWDVSADGKRFLIMVPEGRSTSTSFSLIFGWQRALDDQR